MEAVPIDPSKKGAEKFYLGTVPTPRPRDGEVLVAVKAVALSAWEKGFAQNDDPRSLARRTRKRVVNLGLEFSGTVRSDGRHFKEGQRVMAGPHLTKDEKSLAQYISVREEYLAELPDSLGFPHAAALPIGAETALTGLDKATVRSGDRVLVVGASGGVGVDAVQIAAALGADVTAIGGRNSAPRLKELGATAVHCYRDTSFEDVTGKRLLRGMPRTSLSPWSSPRRARGLRNIGVRSCACTIRDRIAAGNALLSAASRRFAVAAQSGMLVQPPMGGPSVDHLQLHRGGRHVEITLVERHALAGSARLGPVASLLGVDGDPGTHGVSPGVLHPPVHMQVPLLAAQRPVGHRAVDLRVFGGGAGCCADRGRRTQDRSGNQGNSSQCSTNRRSRTHETFLPQSLDVERRAQHSRSGWKREEFLLACDGASRQAAGRVPASRGCPVSAALLVCPGPANGSGGVRPPCPRSTPVAPDTRTVCPLRTFAALVRAR